MMQHFFTAEKIDQFAVIGYSLGGRAAVATLESFPKQTSALMMVAGEGVRKNFWYSWATHPVIGKPLFREMITHPNYFNRIMNRLERFSLVPRVVIEFALRQMSSREKRQRIYSSWIIFSKLYLAPRKLFTISHENRNKLVFVFGKQDPIMKESEVNRLRKILPEATIELINTSHYGLIREIPELLRKYL